MHRALATTLVAAVLCGAIAGGLAALLVNDDSSSPASAALSAPAETTSGKALSAAQTYRRDALGSS